jgi:hypothetical protein
VVEGPNVSLAFAGIKAEAPKSIPGFLPPSELCCDMLKGGRMSKIMNHENKSFIYVPLPNPLVLTVSGRYKWELMSNKTLAVIL